MTSLLNEDSVNSESVCAQPLASTGLVRIWLCNLCSIYRLSSM